MDSTESIKNSSILSTDVTGAPTENIHAGHVGLAIFLSGVILLSVGGNLLVCVAVCTDRHLRKRSNSLYVSLAVADSLVSAVVMPFAVAHEITFRWDFGRFFCRVWQSMDVMCSTSSILHITVIAFDRYMHIRDPFHYGDIMSCRVFCVIIIGIWLFSGLISFIPILLGVHEEKETPQYMTNSPANYLSSAVLSAGTTSTSAINANNSETSQNDCMLELNATYAVLSSCASFFLPSLFMVGLYIRLYIYARRHVTLIKVSTPMLGKSAAVGVGGGTTGTNSQRRKSADHKAAITVGVIMGTFLFCWVPFFTFNVIGSVCKTCIPEILIKVTIWLGYFNSCMNPLIYTLFNLEFRHAFRKILCRGIKRYPGSGTYVGDPTGTMPSGAGGFYSNTQTTRGGTSSMNPTDCFMNSSRICRGKREAADRGHSNGHNSAQMDYGVSTCANMAESPVEELNCASALLHHDVVRMIEEEEEEEDDSVIGETTIRNEQLCQPLSSRSTLLVLSNVNGSVITRTNNETRL